MVYNRNALQMFYYRNVLKGIHHKKCIANDLL